MTMTAAEAIETAFGILKLLSLRDVDALAHQLTDKRLMALALAEIDAYPCTIIEPSRSVIDRASAVLTMEGEMSIEIPFFSMEEGVSDLELRLWLRDGPIVTRIDVLVP